MSETIERASGGCLCGAVRFEAIGVHRHFHACRCRMCQRWGGGPGFAVETQAVRFEDETMLERFDSSDWAQRGFCRRCGSNLFYFLKPTGQHMLQVGTFDDPTPFSMDAEIFVDNPGPDVRFAGDHPRQTAAEVIAASGVSVPD